MVRTLYHICNFIKQVVNNLSGAISLCGYNLFKFIYFIYYNCLTFTIFYAWSNVWGDEPALVTDWVMMDGIRFLYFISMAKFFSVYILG